MGNVVYKTFQPGRIRNIINGLRTGSWAPRSRPRGTKSLYKTSTGSGPPDGILSLAFGLQADKERDQTRSPATEVEP
jgi:hypothetical protein